MTTPYCVSNSFSLPASTPGHVVESSAALQFFSFRGDGMSVGGTAATPIGMTFAVDYRSQAVANVSGAGRCLAINMTGRARSFEPVPNQPPAVACP